VPGLDFLQKYLAEFDAQKARDDLMNKFGLPLHQQLFIKAHTGGERGDGVVRELPASTLSAIKGAVAEDRRLREIGRADQALLNKGVNPLEDLNRRQIGQVDLYSSDEPGARYGLGTVGVYFDQAGNALIKDKWKVDNPEVRYKGMIEDLMEGGLPATMIHDAARALGIYKEIPIEVRVPRSEWEAITPERMPQR
jgi:hypothetical protein